MPIRALPVRLSVENKTINDEILICMVSDIGKVKQAVIGVKGAVHYLEGAVLSTNTQGKFDKLFGEISDLAARALI